MIIEINVTKDGAKLPKVTVNGHLVVAHHKVGQSRELLNELFGLNLTSVEGVFTWSNARFYVEDTLVVINFGSYFEYNVESTGEEISVEIARRLSLLRDAVESARSVSYNYTKKVVI